MSFKALTLGAALIVQPLALSAQPEASAADILIMQELHARTHCLTAAHSGIPSELVWCKVQGSLFNSLVSMGYCFGQEDQSRAEARWHKCKEE